LGGLSWQSVIEVLGDNIANLAKIGGGWNADVFTEGL
jgi:hypothetical protein